MRVNGTLYYVLKDHLGSASVVTDSSGNVVGEQRYYPFGETRLTTGSMFTDKLYTSQREMAGLGIYHYGARFYSPKLGRFLSADSIVPNPSNPQDFNRFAYVRNNPLRYTDPSGHEPKYGEGTCYTSIGNTCLNANGTTIVPGRGLPSKPAPPPCTRNCGGGGGGGGGNPCTSVICLPTSTPQPELPNLPPLRPPETDNEPVTVIPNIPDVIQNAGELYTQLLDMFDYGASKLIKYPYAPYRFIRAFSFNPLVEAGISASLQVVADSNNQLTIRQRVTRGLWAGFEAGAIDVATMPFIYATTAAGTVSGAFVDGPLPIGEGAGAVVTYVVSSLAYNTAANIISVEYVTPWVYTQLDLYDPNGN